ncbi:MAG: hypothetical protein EPN14_02510 [Gallionella sp.]|nr:MAG: hypothetical protein EPN14_02510 [Gallionella sp.]
MNKFERNTDGTMAVPASGEIVAHVFSTGKPPEAIGHALQLLGEENFKALTDYITELEGVSREALLSTLCEEWLGDMSKLAASVSMLSMLSANTALKAVIAQHVGYQRPELIAAMLPFYRTIAGLKL